MENEKFRFGVVGVFIDEAGQILVCERSNLPGVWQFPQGGIDEGETAAVAIEREMREELGVKDFQVIKEALGTTTYFFPPDASFPIAKLFVGQKHSWFLLKFDRESGPDLSKSDGEFQNFRWVSVQDSLVGVVAWKKDAYIQGLKNLNLI